MRKSTFAISTLGILVLVMAMPSAEAQKKRKRPAVAKKAATTSGPALGSNSEANEADFQEAMQLAKAGKYQEASTKLFQMSLSPKYADRRTQLRYILGLMLYQMQLNQLSAFQFISVIRDANSKYLQQGLEKLSLAADALGDDTLLNYAISRVKTDSFPAVHRDMLFYRIGEFQIRNQQYLEATRSLSQVKAASPFSDKAKYLKGYALSAAGDTKSAIDTFDEVIEAKAEAPVTDTARVAALMGKARAEYQQKNWDGAIETYRQVPRDSELWHDTLFETSWAMLRSGRFRSAISQFQSLHSPYYEETYLPESLLLRSIVYLYICQYDEMDKVLNLFNKVYRPVYKEVNTYLSTVKNPVTYFNDVIKIIQASEKAHFDPSKASFSLPYLITQKVTKEGDFQRSFQYIKKLIEERRRINALPTAWRNSGLGKYARQTIDRRLQRARAKAGRQIRAHMLAVRAELLDLFEQEGFIRYEMINGKKESLKKRVAGKELPKTQINEDQGHDYYIQNGYQYWTFRGEYWLDELGNYHYVGTQSCD